MQITVPCHDGIGCLVQVNNNAKLQDWEGLRPHVSFPRYLRYLSWRSTSLLTRRASTFFLLHQLELACYIAAAFLRAHRMTRNHLRAFIGWSYQPGLQFFEFQAWLPAAGTCSL